ncbi:MAG: tetratricopeptide repeat protein [Bacteroidetes bacterium]|nr:MAG: tetratricopeptide repeat protein [Bacteroidota bacterium]
MSTEIDRLERELEHADGDEKRLELLLDLVYQLKDEEFVEGWKRANEALDIAERLNDRAACARALEGLANILWKLAEFSQSISQFERALDKYLGMGDLYGVARCYCGMGIISGSMEEYRTSLEYFEEGLSAARRAGRAHLSATITGNIGHVYFNLGRYHDAMECFQHGLNFYTETNDAQGTANMLGGMAGIHVFQGEYGKGLELVRRALVLHKQEKHKRGIAVSLMNIGLALQKMGKLQQARTELKSALNYARSIGLKMSEYETLKHLSQVCSELGFEEEASQYLRLYMDGQKEENKENVKRKNEQFRQRQLIRELQRR